MLYFIFSLLFANEPTLIEMNMKLQMNGKNLSPIYLQVKEKVPQKMSYKLDNEEYEYTITSRVEEEDLMRIHFVMKDLVKGKTLIDASIITFDGETATMESTKDLKKFKLDIQPQLL